MFGLEKILKGKEKAFDKDAIAKLLGTRPELLEKFEESYRKHALSEEISSDNFFDINSRQASSEVRRTDLPEYSEEYIESLLNRITKELVSETEEGKLLADEGQPSLVTKAEINALPKDVRPQLSGNLITVDLGGQPSYVALLDQYRRYLQEKDPKKKMQWYYLFRQGLDILDLDPIVYEMLGKNPNSIGYWFPELEKAVKRQGFFRVPETKIIKVPLPILQLTRLDYFSLNPATLKVVDDFCMKAFDLDVTKTYFIKTGTYSSKFDFRNAKVTGEKEVRELGEYLLFIHAQANAMAHPTNRPACIYGVSTTNEWCVREYIEDREGNPCIYKGLPLHTEYRAFVDFDTNEILGISPYWRADVMKKRFSEGNDADSPHQMHDYIVYSMHEETLMRRYAENKEKVEKNLQQVVAEMDLHGQWSIDVMQNGDDFWVIDMALAENSALSDCVPAGRLRKSEEDWLPRSLPEVKDNSILLE